MKTCSSQENGKLYDTGKVRVIQTSLDVNGTSMPMPPESVV